MLGFYLFVIFVFKYLFFFLQISNFVLYFLVFGSQSYATYQVEKFVTLVRKSTRCLSFYYFKEDVLEFLLDLYLCDAVRIVNKSC